MVHVITQPCCNDAACVTVCPVDCIHPTPDEPGYGSAEMLYIDGSECIDCGACVDACPVEAIFPEENLPPTALAYVELNALHYQTEQPRSVTTSPVRLRLDEVEPLRVAIVGSGPAGMYAADELLSQRGLEVDIHVFERLLIPWGLVRFGVAPDHPGTKGVVRDFERTAQDARVTMHLGVEVGRDVTHDDLAAHHHAVIYAVGASGDRRLGIPGEELPGSAAATEFVGWYNGHPDYVDSRFDLSGERVVIVGNGNVALDIARILTSDIASLSRTDIADHAREALASSAVREVVVLGRRGPAEASYTTPELLALGDLPGVDLTMNLDDSLQQVDHKIDPLTAFKVKVVREFAARPRVAGNKHLALRFWETPQLILGETHVTGLRVERTELVLDPSGRIGARATGQTHDLDCSLVLRSIGYRGNPVAGLPFDATRGVVPNNNGRVIDPVTGDPLAGVFVTGWIKRGPSGVIGTNKKCAKDTVAQLTADHVAGRLPAPRSAPADFTALLSARKSPLYDYSSWAAIDNYERAAGTSDHRPRVKVTDSELQRLIARQASSST